MKRTSRNISAATLLAAAMIATLSSCSGFYATSTVGPDLYLDNYYGAPGYDYVINTPPPPPPGGWQPGYSPGYNPPPFSPGPSNPAPSRPVPGNPGNPGNAGSPDYGPGGGTRPSSGTSNNPASRPSNGGYRGNNR